MKHCTLWSFNNHENFKESSQNESMFFMISRQLEPVTKKIIGNKKLHQGLKSCSGRKVPLLKKAHVQAHLRFATEHLNNSKENGLKVLPSDELKKKKNDLWHQHNLLCLVEKECCL